MSSTIEKKVADLEGLNLLTERVDDIPLLLETMKRMGLHEVLDNHIAEHWKQRTLSWGWTGLIWLGYILSEGDHRKASMEEYIKGTKITISELTSQTIDDKDFLDDRLSNFLSYLSKPEVWHGIENELNERTISVYELPQEIVRCDATTVSGYHEVTENRLFQFGHSKDDASLPQIKVMSGALDPLGMPLATEVLPGQRADDGLYIPLIKRIDESLDKKGLIYVGDCKISAFDNRLYIRGNENHYICPLSQVGKTAEEMENWIRDGIIKDKEGNLRPVSITNDKGEEVLLVKGYEFERAQAGKLNKKEVQWNERVLIVNSPSHAHQQEKGLERRLETAMEKLNGLTPERGKGKKQITDEGELTERIEKILKKHKVEGLVIFNYDKEVERQEKYVGKGRGAKNREKTVVERIRYQITKVTRDEEKIKEEKERCGWKAFVTDVPVSRLSFSDIIKCYRQEYRVERIFNRLKSRLNISPLFVKKEDQIQGLTNLLNLAVRVGRIYEFGGEQLL